MTRIIIFIHLILIGGSAFAQKRSIEYNVSAMGFVSTKEHLPFWAISNKYGLIPDGNGGLVELGVFSNFTPKHKVQFAYGVSAAGYSSKPENKLLIDQLYISSQWKKLRLDLGMIHRTTEYAGISSTNGSILFSNNARTMPGYNIYSQYIAIPFTQNIVSFKGNLSDYLLLDNRYVQDAYLHNKSLFFKFRPAQRIEFIVGLEHSAIWAGTSPRYGKQPSSFNDYLRIFFGQSGGEGSTVSDSSNKLGNHLGNRQLRLNYLGEQHTISLHYQNILDDGNFYKNYQSCPDGVYSFYYGSNTKRRWISDFIYEFTYTKHQSGRYHDRPATEEEKAEQDPSSPFYGIVILGGNDEYFNNGEYQSGWTLYGRTIGTPLITPNAPDEAKIVFGVRNNRVIGHHIGIKGMAFRKLPYKLMLTYTLNYGRYTTPLADHSLKQFSCGLETRLPLSSELPFNVDAGIYGDIGKFRSNNFGVTLKLTRNGVIR